MSGSSDASLVPPPKVQPLDDPPVSESKMCTLNASEPPHSHSPTYEKGSSPIPPSPEPISPPETETIWKYNVQVRCSHYDCYNCMNQSQYVYMCGLNCTGSIVI